jgi:hypothetical protein
MVESRFRPIACGRPTLHFAFSRQRIPFHDPEKLHTVLYIDIASGFARLVMLSPFVICHVLNSFLEPRIISWNNIDFVMYHRFN